MSEATKIAQEAGENFLPKLKPLIAKGPTVNVGQMSDSTQGDYSQGEIVKNAYMNSVLNARSDSPINQMKGVRVESPVYQASKNLWGTDNKGIKHVSVSLRQGSDSRPNQNLTVAGPTISTGGSGATRSYQQWIQFESENKNSTVSPADMYSATKNIDALAYAPITSQTLNNQNNLDPRFVEFHKGSAPGNTHESGLKSGLIPGTEFPTFITPEQHSAFVADIQERAKKVDPNEVKKTATQFLAGRQRIIEVDSAEDFFAHAQAVHDFLAPEPALQRQFGYSLNITNPDESISLVGTTKKFGYKEEQKQNVAEKNKAIAKAIPAKEIQSGISQAVEDLSAGKHIGSGAGKERQKVSLSSVKVGEQLVPDPKQRARQISTNAQAAVSPTEETAQTGPAPAAPAQVEKKPYYSPSVPEDPVSVEYMSVKEQRDKLNHKGAHAKTAEEQKEAYAAADELDNKLRDIHAGMSPEQRDAESLGEIARGNENVARARKERLEWEALPQEDKELHMQAFLHELVEDAKRGEGSEFLRQRLLGSDQAGSGSPPASAPAASTPAAAAAPVSTPASPTTTSGPPSFSPPARKKGESLKEYTERVNRAVKAHNKQHGTNVPAAKKEDLKGGPKKATSSQGPATASGAGGSPPTGGTAPPPLTNSAGVRINAPEDMPPSKIIGKAAKEAGFRGGAKRFFKGLAGSLIDIGAATVIGGGIGFVGAAMSYNPDEEKNAYFKGLKFTGRMVAAMKGAVSGAEKGAIGMAGVKGIQSLAGISIEGDISQGVFQDTIIGNVMKGFSSVNGTSALKGPGTVAEDFLGGMNEIPLMAGLASKEAIPEYNAGLKKAIAEADPAKRSELLKKLEARQGKLLAPDQVELFEKNKNALFIRDLPKVAGYAAGALGAVPFATMSAVAGAHDEYVAKPFSKMGEKGPDLKNWKSFASWKEYGKGQIAAKTSIFTKNAMTDETMSAGGIFAGAIGFGFGTSLIAAGATPMIASMATAPFTSAFEASGMAAGPGHPYNAMRRDPAATAKAQMEADASNKIKMSRPNMIGLNDIDEAYFTNPSFKGTRSRHTPGKYNDDGNLTLALSALRRG